MANEELDVMSMMMPIMMMVVMLGILPSLTGTTTPEPEPGTGDAGALAFIVKDADGNVIWSPTAQQVGYTPQIMLTPGQAYSITDIVATNASTKLGVPWAATLTVEIVLFSDIIGSIDYDFEAGESHTFEPLHFTPTLAQEGLTGVLTGNLKSPAGAVIASVSLSAEVGIATIDYGGGITIGAGDIALRIKNPPVGTNWWQFGIFNTVWGLNEYIVNVPIADIGVYSGLPVDWAYPVLLDLIFFQNSSSPFNVTGKMQSGYGIEWLNYLDVNIPGPGLYEYDHSAQTLVLVSA